MRCSQLETRLNELLDRRDDPRSNAEIAAHTAACPRCRRLTSAYVAVALGSERLRSPASPVLSRPIGLHGVAGAMLAVAAALLVYVTGVAGPSSVDVASKAPPAVRPIRAVTELAREVGRTYAAFIHGTARSVDEAFVLASSLPPPDELLDPVLFPDDGLLKRFGDEWAPAAGATFDSLGRVFVEDATL